MKLKVTGDTGRGVGRYLEGQGDLVSMLIVGITGVILWLIGVISVLTLEPKP